MKKGIYKHYKGPLYEVIGEAIHSETREELVLYICLYEDKELIEKYSEMPYFVRPKNMFLEDIEIEGKKKKRFEYIGTKKHSNL